MVESFVSLFYYATLVFLFRVGLGIRRATFGRVDFCESEAYLLERGYVKSEDLAHPREHASC